MDDLPMLARGTVVADRISFDLGELKYEYPDEPVPPGKTAIQHLRHLAWEGAAWRFPGGVPEKVRRTIEKELDLIERLDFPNYFLTVHDIVRWARSEGILCQGRGSAANSCVCFCMGVTALCLQPLAANHEQIPLITRQRINPFKLNMLNLAV